ncbi:glutamic acid-rich protein-like [Aphidius gifuensis]|uniref:glutamic acid-rich protein-like n=1 Tax=Aphidius gifuensis TaxID=684658 RepID=UPI001CDD5335|nr:glutamic acid-rich protein-like [Aphidius gifuensis]
MLSSDDDDEPQIPKKSPAKTPKIIKTTTDNISSSKKSDNKIKVTKKTPKSSSVLTKEEKINENGKDNDDDDIVQQDMEKIKKKLFKKQKSQEVTKTFVDKSTQTIESSLKSKKSTKNNADGDNTSVVKTAQAKKTNIKKNNTDEVVEDEKKNVVSDEEIEKLKNMKIKLVHEPPSQHLIENNPANHQSSPVEREEFEKFIKIKKGFYNNEEDHLITKNWNEFCILHDWDKKNVEPFINLRHGKKYYIPDAGERKNFFRFLGNGLDNRPLSSIFTRFSNLYSTKKTQRFTIIEDDYITKYLLDHKDDNKQQIFAHLTAKLNRPRDAIARRIRMLQARGNKPKTNEKKNTSSAIKDDVKKSSDEQIESPKEQHESSEEQHESSEEEQHQSSEEQNQSSEEQHQSSDEQHESSEEEQKSSSEDENDSD